MIKLGADTPEQLAKVEGLKAVASAVAEVVEAQLGEANIGYLLVLVTPGAMASFTNLPKAAATHLVCDLAAVASDELRKASS